MDLNLGKKIFSSFEDAEKAAASMRKSKSEPFKTYKVNGGWAVGGVHLNTPAKKVKSLSDLKTVLNNLKSSDEDDSVEEYIDLIESESKSDKINTVFGTEQIWRLISYSEKSGTQLGMKNNKNYLVLEITNGTEIKKPKMGGAFEPHIPLMKKIAETLINSPVIWHTWNPKSNPNQWNNDSWFYRLEENDF